MSCPGQHPADWHLRCSELSDVSKARLRPNCLILILIMYRIRTSNYFAQHSTCLSFFFLMALRTRSLRMSMALVMLILRAPPPRCPASRSSTSLFLNFSSPSEVRSCLPPLYRDRSPSWNSLCHLNAKHVTILPLACCWARWGHQLCPPSVRVPILLSGGWGHGPCCVEAGQSCSISSYCSIKHLLIKKKNERIKTDGQHCQYCFHFWVWVNYFCFIDLFLKRGFASLDPSKAKVAATTVRRKDKAIPSEHWPNPSLFIWNNGETSICYSLESK